MGLDIGVQSCVLWRSEPRAAWAQDNQHPQPIPGPSRELAQPRHHSPSRVWKQIHYFGDKSCLMWTNCHWCQLENRTHFYLSTGQMRSIWGSGDVYSGEKKEKRRPREDLITLYDHLKGCCTKVGISLFFQITNDITRENGLRMHQGRFR